MSALPRAYRHNALWSAALIHRLSGIGLAIFLPLHFLVLGLAIEGAGRLDGFLRFTQMPAVALAEAGLIFLLVVHFLGGLRLLAIENVPWFGGQKRIAAAIATVSGVAAFLFLVRAL
jgi:fumarate reductase subunit D